MDTLNVLVYYVKDGPGLVQRAETVTDESGELAGEWAAARGAVWHRLYTFRAGEPIPDAPTEFAERMKYARRLAVADYARSLIPAGI